MQRISGSQFSQTLIAAAIILISVWFGEQLRLPMAGWAVAALTLIALGYWARTTPVSAGLIACVYLIMLLVGATPQPWGILLAIAAIMFGVSLGALALDDFFAGSNINPVAYIFQRYIGWLFEPQIVDPPSAGMVDGDSRVLGPRLVTINPDAAVLLRGRNHVARIMGPGNIQTRPLEHVAKIFNLRPIHRNFVFRSVLTNDTTPLTIELLVIYGIRVREDARLWASSFVEQDQQSLRRVIAATPDWEVVLHGLIDKNLRRAVGVRTLAENLDIALQQLTVADTLVLTGEDTRNWGLRIYELHMVSLQPDTNVVEARLQNWLTEVTNATYASRELARGEAWASALASITVAYQTAHEARVPDPLILRELVRRLFEQASLDPETRSLLLAELGHMLTRRDVDRDPGP